MGSRFEPTQLFCPQRSATQMLVPSLSISTALVEPHARPSGSFAHPSIVWYGLGALLVGCALACARATTPDERSAATAARSVDRARRVCCIGGRLKGVDSLKSVGKAARPQRGATCGAALRAIWRWRCTGSYSGTADIRR